MTKTDRIKKYLEAGKLSNKEIAHRVGCLPEYVRAIKRRLADRLQKAA